MSVNPGLPVARGTSRCPISRHYCKFILVVSVIIIVVGLFFAVAPRWSNIEAGHEYDHDHEWEREIRMIIASADGILMHHIERNPDVERERWTDR